MLQCVPLCSWAARWCAADEWRHVICHVAALTALTAIIAIAAIIASAALAALTALTAAIVRLQTEPSR